MSKKTIITITFLIVIGFLLGFDVVRSKQYHINLVSIHPDVIEADGQTEVKITTRLTDNKGRPVEGHNLFAVPVGGGTMRANRETTDEDGLAEFKYFPYKASNTLPAKDVTLTVVDESNSVFFEINARNDFVLRLVKPTKENDKGKVDLDSIFGE